MDVVPDVDKLSQIFSNAIVPAFFLGAVAAFVALMMSRLDAVNNRIKATGLLHEDRSAATTAVDPLTRRARLLSHGIIASLASGICATLLLAILFSTQFFRWHHAMVRPFSFSPPLCCWELGCSASPRKPGMHTTNWTNSDETVRRAESRRSQATIANAKPVLRCRRRQFCEVG